ncbi:MAG: hypothetical protein R3C56_38250, partial [Pirellulaceae bacterium]
MVSLLGAVGAIGYFGWNEWNKRGPVASKPAADIASEQPPTTSDPPEPAPTVSGESANGFQFGNLESEIPIEKIRVSITTDEHGAALGEPVELHLGLGFPLRLHPLGASSPIDFSAVAQKSSLPADRDHLEPGEEAWFEFEAAPDESGSDVLRTTPQLLSGLKVGDISKIGFASTGQSDWKLAGYVIEINDQLFASNNSVDAGPEEVMAQDEQTLTDSLPRREVLVNQLDEYEALASAGYLSDTEQLDWEAARTEVASLDGPIQWAGGRLMGQYPWYEEQAAEFDVSGAPVMKPIDVTLVTSSKAQSGTLNTVYLLAGAKKYQLASSTSPLRNGPESHHFQISAIDLERDPLDESDLKQIGIGVVGGGHRFAEAADRAKLDRVLVSVGDQPAYDSELELDDRITLGQIELLPPAHVDDSGKVVENVMTSDRERPMWRAGDRLAAPRTPSSVPAVASQPEPEPPTVLTPSPFAAVASGQSPDTPAPQRGSTDLGSPASGNPPIASTGPVSSSPVSSVPPSAGGAM